MLMTTVVFTPPLPCLFWFSCSFRILLRIKTMLMNTVIMRTMNEENRENVICSWLTWNFFSLDKWMRFGICTINVCHLWCMKLDIWKVVVQLFFFRWCKVIVVITQQCIFLCHPDNSLDFMRDWMMCKKRKTATKTGFQ